MANRLMWWALGGLVCTGCAVSVVALAQWAEERYLPVVKGFVINSQTKVGNGLQISGEMTKVREYCRFIEVAAYAGKSYLNLEFKDVAPVMLGHSRAGGEQTWGPWLITPYHDEIKLIARHRCHFLWDSTTVLIDQ